MTRSPPEYQLSCLPMQAGPPTRPPQRGASLQRGSQPRVQALLKFVPGLQRKLQQVKLYTPNQRAVSHLADLDSISCCLIGLTGHDGYIAGAGTGYGNPGRKTLAHPDYTCITRWWHPSKNGGSRPANFTHGSHKRVWLQCHGCPRCGEVHEWDACVCDLTKLKAASGIVCPFCDSRSKLRRFCSCRSIAADSRLLEEWHPDNPDPATVAVASNVQKYKWRCTAGRGHADYEARPDARSTYGTGCPACAAEQKGKLSHGSLAQQRPDLAAEWDAARNRRPPGQLTCGSDFMAWWRCSQCQHSWQAQVDVRAAKGYGCPRCRESNRMKPRKHTGAGLVGDEHFS